ncbi:MAG: uncharacterized SAM-binding protein YcdF (DUF218 family) [Paraglaciecola sp.]|jgi:uncharacterized SAM-binding protein YcdF (DUF218 family)
MVLQGLANNLSSPLVHGPLIFIILRVLAYLSNDGKLLYRLSFLPLLWLFICSMTYPSVLMVKYLEDQYPVVQLTSEQWQRTDAIVVLACNYFDDDELPFVSRWPRCSLQRNLHAALMYQIKTMPIYLGAGVLSKEDSNSQAAFNASFLRKLGVKAEDIHVFPGGKDTQSEVATLAPALQGKSVSLVTSATHQLRAVEYFNRQGIKVLAIPVEHLSRRKIEFILGLPNAQSLYRSERAIHEYLGLIYQKIFL